MATDDFLKYMTRAKGAYFSRYNIEIETIEIIEENDDAIIFRIKGTSNGPIVKVSNYGYFNGRT